MALADNNFAVISSSDNANITPTKNAETTSNANGTTTTTATLNQYEENVEHLRKLFDKWNVVSFNIKHIECSAGSSSGDNYMSVVKRVRIHQCEKGAEEAGASEASNIRLHSVIIKRQIASPSRRELYRCEEAFTNEIHAYNYVVPMLLRYSTRPLFPECHIATKHDGSTSGEPIIVLEDLKSIGYRMQDRRAGLTLNHCKLVMKKLAELHAASLAAKHLQREEYRVQCEHLNEIVYCKAAAGFYSNILDASIQQALDSLRGSNIDGSLSEPIRLIEHMQPYLFDQIRRSINHAAQTQSAVISHGDLWVNNIMFSHIKNAENPVEHDEVADRVIFFDLQAMRITSPVFDILHFVFTSTRRRLREDHINTILTIYCNALADNLQLQLAHTQAAPEVAALLELFSLKHLSEEFERHVYYGLAICMWILPAVTFDPDNIPNLDAISEQNTNAKEIKCTQILTPDYHERMKELALEFYEKGYLNRSYDSC